VVTFNHLDVAGSGQVSCNDFIRVCTSNDAINMNHMARFVARKERSKGFLNLLDDASIQLDHELRATDDSADVEGYNDWEEQQRARRSTRRGKHASHTSLTTEPRLDEGNCQLTSLSKRLDALEAMAAGLDARLTLSEARLADRFTLLEARCGDGPGTDGVGLFDAVDVDELAPSMPQNQLLDNEYHRIVSSLKEDVSQLASNFLGSIQEMDQRCNRLQESLQSVGVDVAGHERQLHHGRSRSCSPRLACSPRSEAESSCSPQLAQTPRSVSSHATASRFNINLSWHQRRHDAQDGEVYANTIGCPRILNDSC